MAPHFVMQHQVMKKFAGFQDLASPIRPDTVPMLNALQRIQTYQDFHLQQQDTVNTKTQAVAHILAQIEFVQDWNSTEASTYTAYADRLLPLYHELAPATEELRCIEQVLLPDILEQAVGLLKHNQALSLGMKEVVLDQIKSLDSRLADLGIRPAQPVRRRSVDRGEGSTDILVDCMQYTDGFFPSSFTRSPSLDRRKSDSEDRHGNMKMRRTLGSQTRERVVERRMLGEKLASWFLEPDHSTSSDDGQSASPKRATKRPGISIVAAGASSEASAQPAAPKGFQTNGWTSVNAPAPPRQKPSPTKKPRTTTGGLHLPKIAAHPPLQPSPKTGSLPPGPPLSSRRGLSLDRASQPLQPPPHPRQASPRPVITPTEGRRRIILESPSSAGSDPAPPGDVSTPSTSNPAPPPPAPLAAVPTQPSQPPAPAQPATSSQASPGNKRKRDEDDEATDPAAESTSQAGPSTKRVREQPAPAAARARASASAAAPVVAPPAPAAVNAAPTNAAPAPKYVRGGVKSKFLGEAEALASHVAPDGKTRRSGRVSKKRGA